MNYRYLFEPLRLGTHTMKNRIMCAPMVFGAVVQYPEAAPRMYRKVEASARGGAALAGNRLSPLRVRTRWTPLAEMPMPW